jgi:fatty-acyl-CoA synthase/fatty acid CoA ligase FadD22
MDDRDANLTTVLERRAAHQGWMDRPAWSVGEGAVSGAVSHRGVYDGAARTASLLAAAGVGSGDRVLIALTDGPELCWAFLGALRLGAIAVPVNPRLHVDDHRRMTERCRPGVVVCSRDLAENFGAIPAVAAEDLAERVAALGRHPGLVVESPEAPAYAQFTSGTTGRPKAAVHRHNDPLVYHRAFATAALDLRPDDVVLSVSKLHFAYGLGNTLFFPLLSGCRAVLHADAPRPDVIADLVEHHGVTVLFAVPTFYAHLLATGREAAFASLRAAVSAGEALMPELGRRTSALLGCPVLDGLGSTEVGQTFVSNTLHSRRDGTVGRALPPYEVSVRDDARQALPAGRLGTLWVRGPTVMLEYLGQPEATAANMDGDWLCTGDRAMLDPDGFVTLRGRVDDLEMVGGVSVAPLEIEEVLGVHPSVIEVAVAGVRDELGASRLEAFVVPAAGVGPALEAELMALARDRLAPHKVPRAIHLVTGLPRTATGKLRRFVLRAGGGVRSEP